MKTLDMNDGELWTATLSGQTHFDIWWFDKNRYFCSSGNSGPKEDFRINIRSIKIIL